MAGRFSQSRAAGTYQPGNVGNNGISFVPAQMVPAMSAWGGVYSTGQAPPLFDAFGRPLPWSAFHSQLDSAPGSPLAPRFPDPETPPREYQINPGFNLIAQPRTEEPGAKFSELRALADACPYLKIAFEYRQKQIRGAKWSVHPREGKTPAARKAHQAAIDAVSDFLRKPNRVDGLRFGEFMVQATREVLETDATVFFKHPTMDGKAIHSLVQIDGATIKQLIDQFGHVVGYQQVLYGYPTTQYPNGQALESDARDLSGRIIYLCSNPSIDSAYGLTIVEQIRPIIETAILRMQKQRYWYSDGTTPDGFLMAPDADDWRSPETIRKAQRYFDDEGLGTIRRSKLTWLPGGTSYVPTKPYNYTKEEEEAIVSAICAATGVPRSIFVAQVNRATAEEMRDDSADIGFRPLLQFHKDWIDDFIQNDLARQIPGAEELEFDWETERAGNELTTAQAVVAYVNAGVMTVDEVREEKGLDPLPEDERPEAKLAAMTQAMGGKIPPKDGEEPKAGEKPAAGDKPPAKTEDDEKAEKAELVAWEKFARRRVEKGRHAAEFVVAHLSPRVSDVVVRGLKTASTDADVRDVFAAARAELAKEKSSLEHAFESSVKRMFRRQKEQVIERAKARLKPKEEAA